MQAELAAVNTRKMLRGVGVRQVRLTAGLILFTYLISHFVNHSLGNVSLDAMEYGLQFHMALWRSWPGTLLLYPALAVHGSLGLWALYQRRQFKWKKIELTQLILGLSIPALLCSHLIGQRLGAELWGLQKSYGQTLYNLWLVRPDLGVKQVTLLIVAWTHGCIGMYLWLRLRSFFPRVAPLLLAGAVLLPSLALLGFYQQGRTVLRLAQDPHWQAEYRSVNRIGTAAQRATLMTIHDNFLYAWIVAIGLVFVARGARVWRERRHGTIRLAYPDRSLRVPKGWTVLEASLRYKVPHASVCGGRARCSTCRIRVLGDRSRLPPPSARELYVLGRVGALRDPAIRLACQLRPQGDIALVPLLPPQVNTSFVHGRSNLNPGEERFVVCMFVDMRGSTAMSEKRLAFDTVFIINRFLAAVSQAVTEAGGQPNQYLGDGLLALFGLKADPQTACRQALNAAAMIAGNVDHLNRMFAEAERQPIRFGIGIHAGDVIVGDIGYRDKMVFTALGDSVNVTARLEQLTKELDCQVVLSDLVLKTAGLPLDALPASEVAIRGQTDRVAVRVVADAALLSSIFEHSADAAFISQLEPEPEISATV